ncbi:MAG: MFS transporter [Chloroflexi bacterium]|nr:MFS transporter [Chloroflexota bacterium]
MTAAPAVPYAGWKRNLAFIWIGVFVGLLGANFVFPFIPFYIKELGVEDKARIAYFTGLTGSATGLSLTLTAPIWGALADRYGRKPMFLRALIGAGILIGIMGVVQAVWQLVLLRFAMGAFAGTMGAAAALVAATTPRERVGYALGLLQTGVFTANMLGPFIGGIVAANLGIRESFFFCAALYVLAAVLAYVFVREPKGALPPEEDGKEHGGGLVANLKVVVAERQIVLMLSLLFALWLSTTYVRPVMPISIDDFSHATTDSSGKELDRVNLHILGRRWELKEEAATGVVFGIIGLTSTIAALVVAPLGARIGYRKCVAGAAALSGGLYMTVAFAGSFTSFMLLLGAVGLFQGAMVPGTNALIAASTPEGKQGSAFGLAASMQSMALLVGPLAGGFTSGLLGIEAVYVVIGVILLVAAAGGSLFIREPAVLRRDGGRPGPARH